MHRSELKNADYNPRTIDEKSRRKLKAGIQKLGMLAPIVWNARTGNIVGGHQRISVLDQLHKTRDYTVRVARVDLDDKQEREANILLNNQHAMGEFDLGKLGAMIKDDQIDIMAAGFDMADVYRLFGDAPEAVGAQAIDAIGDRLREVKDKHERHRATLDKRDGVNFYLVVVFQNEADRDSFVEAAGLDDNRFQDGNELRRLILGQSDSSDTHE